MPLPNFLVIGAAKSGTSSLWLYLRQHPQIFLPYRKEPHFFSYEGAVPNTQGPRDYVNQAITEWDAYGRLFAEVDGATAIGEVSPTYLQLPHVAARIKARLPGVKLIAILRDPAERAFSAYMHLRRDGREPLADFMAALSAEPERRAANWEPLWQYVQGGFYHAQLAPYQQHFAPEQLCILLYDDLRSDPVGTMQSIFRFLSVDDTFVPDVQARTNVSGLPKNKALHNLYMRLFDEGNLVKSLSRLLIPETLRWRATSALRNRNLARTTIPRDARRYLIDHYRNDILQLQALLDRDLSAWLQL
jgi:hypothetical protein